jgi:hypothetical protein
LSNKLCVIARTRYILSEGVSEPFWSCGSPSGRGSISLSVASSILTWTGTLCSFLGWRHSLAQCPCFLQLKYFPFCPLSIVRPDRFPWRPVLAFPCRLPKGLVWTTLRSIGCSHDAFCWGMSFFLVYPPYQGATCPSFFSIARS